MKTLRHLVVLSGLFALAAGSASAQQYERFGRNDRQSLNLDPAKINLIASARAPAHDLALIRPHATHRHLPLPR